MSTTEVLLVTHLLSSAALLGVLWLVIVVQAVCRRAARLRRPSARLVTRRAAVPAAVRFSEVDPHRQLQSSA